MTLAPTACGDRASGGSGGSGADSIGGDVGASETASDAGDASTSVGEDDGGEKLDVAGAEETGDGDPMDGYCDFVDLLFVIDNSVSMQSYQEALALAFPQFANTLSQALPEGVNLHVGVTSSEMGYAGSGSTSISNGVCTFTGDGMPSDNFYVTPDQQNTQTNGAQGRLYQPAGAQHYFSLDIGDTAQLSALESWFSDAAAIGTGGSNIEMTLAPAGWVGDPANTATNAGFLRDAGAVLVVFFMTDEPDQTPVLIDGVAGGQYMLDRVASFKSACGGLNCVVGGGFLRPSACEDQPLDAFLAGLPDAAQVAELPDDNLPPQQAADQMNALLADTFAAVIADKCDEIPPVG